MSSMKRFTVYRLDMDSRDTHTEFQKNPEGDPQFEGVVFTDGSVALRWLTPIRSTSIWADLKSALLVHRHPEYGSRVVWHDHEVTPQEWLEMLYDSDE